MSVVKVYSISVDLPNGCDLSRLDREIRLTTHVTSFSGLTMNGDVLEVLGASLVDGAGLDAVIAAHDPSVADPDRLRIRDIIGDLDDEEIKRTNVTLLDLEQEAWDYSRGARTERLYKNSSGDLVVKHFYSYTMANGNRDLGSVTHTFEWYKNDNTVGLSKVINKIMTVKSLGELNRIIRIGRMTDLRENARAIGRADIVDNIYSFYGQEIKDYEDYGSMSFETAVINEINGSRRAVLDESIPQFGSLTVEQLIAWQLVGAYSWT